MSVIMDGITFVSSEDICLLNEIKGPVLYLGNPHFTRQRGFSALHVAAANIHDNVTPVIMFISMGVNIDAENELGQTALHIATICRNKNIIGVLLHRGANVKALDKQKRSPLHWAVLASEKERGSIDYKTDVSIVASLLKNAPFVDSENREKETPLIYASYRNNAGIVLQLLKNGANINHQDFKNRTALIISCLRKKHNVVKILLEFGANVDLKRENRNTALHYAALSSQMDSSKTEYKNDLLILKLLLDKNPNLDDRNIHGETPLMFAAKGSHLDNLKLLLEAGAKVKIKNRNGENCLHIVLSNTTPNKIKMMTEIIKAGISIEEEDREGRNAVHCILRSNIPNERSYNELGQFIKIASLVKYPEKIRLHATPEITSFVNKCFIEVRKIKTLKFDIFVGDVAFLSGGSSIVYDFIFEMIRNKEIVIYKNVIIDNVNRSYLIQKLMKMETKSLDFPHHCFPYLCKFLTNSEILNVITAFM